MTRSIETPVSLAIVAAFFLGGPVIGQSPAITGEVRSLKSQPLSTPAANGAPVVLRYYIEDGAEVTAGQPVMRTDPGQDASRLRGLEGELSDAENKAARDIAELEVKAVDAALAAVDAEASFATARIDAALPRELISALEFDRYQGEFQRTQRELSLKQQEETLARAAVERRRHDSKLELKRLRLEQQFVQAKVDAVQLRAESAGIVLHAIDPMGKRFDEGSTSFAGMLVGEVVSPGAMAVRAYALETDRKYFVSRGAVSVEFDALPGERIVGHVQSISAAPSPRLVWGDGRYFTIDIDLPASAQTLRLLPGMSAKVRALPAQVAARRIGE